MPTLGHPSELSPRLPDIALTLADEWVVEPGGDALLRATHGPAGDLAPELTAYVHTSHEATTHDLVDDLAIAAEGRDEGHADPTFEVELDGRTWTGLNLSWIEGGEPVYVVHLVTAIESAAVTQFIRLTGRVAGPDSEADYERLQQAMETVHLGAAEAEDA